MALKFTKNDLNQLIPDVTVDDHKDTEVKDQKRNNVLKKSAKEEEEKERRRIQKKVAFFF